jgi:ubiquinone/menaquinone biosynthesis C-methylase UbiE
MICDIPLVWVTIHSGAGQKETHMALESFNQKVKLNVAENFDKSCQIYQAFEDKHHLFANLALKLAESIGLQPGSRILDVGCGNGISARALQERFACRVLGVDLSPKMVAFGRTLIGSEDIELIVGDGEKLTALTRGALFDYVLYNASIFIFPDVTRTLADAWACLQPGGKIAFSFYPELVGPDEKDLFAIAFQRLGEPQPRFRMITDYTTACEALEHRCGSVRHHSWQRPLDIEFLQDFFSIPAQSASLFPGRDYGRRRDMAVRLFAGLADLQDQSRIVWRMAEGSKVRKAP